MSQQHQPAPKHKKEQERLKALENYGILDTQPEPELDNIVKLAADICQMPVSLISLVAENKQWFKAEIGAGIRETDVNVSMCAHAILQSDIFEVEDATKDERFQYNPLVTGEPHIRSYTAATLETPDGLPLGTLCVLGFEPRVLNEHQKFALKTLATQVMTQLELRRSLKERMEAQVVSESFRRIYETVVSNTPDFIYVIDLDKRFSYANQALLTMWGKSAEETAGKSFIELGYEPWHAEMHNNEIDEVLSTRKSIRGQVPFTGTHGRRIYDYIFTPVFDADGHITAIAGTTRDITEHEETQEALRKSDARREMALEASEFVGTWDWDLEKNIVYSDERLAVLYSIDASLAMTGAPQEEYLKSIHPEDISGIKTAFDISLATDAPYNAEHRLLKKDGTIRWVSSKGRIHFNDQKVPVRVSGVTIDITDRKLVEQQLKQMTDAIPQQVWAARADGLYDYVNEHTHHYVGDIPVKNGIIVWADIVHPDDLEEAQAAWQQAIKTGEPYEAQQRFFHKESGTYRWHLSRALPIKNDNGQIIKWYGTNTDIEEQKRALEELTIARNIAESANIAKTEFLANMSHEIRTPMNAVIGLSNILALSKPLTAKQMEFIQTLQLSADSLLALINDLLDITKIETKNVELEEIPFSVVQLMQEVSGMMLLQAKKKKIEFTFDSEDSLIRHSTFLGDPTRLRQIMLNLCSNAVKFTETGSVHVAISSKPADKDGYELISLAVCDTGIGIDKQHMDTIFQKFVQADSSINRKYGGTGLGLAITKTLAEIMGGDITIESIKGRGSTFTLTVPLKVTKSEGLRKKDTTAETSPNAADNGQPHILLVEDYAPNVMVAEAFLEEFGYTCDTAVNGLEAIEKIKSYTYDLVLMDVQMHGMNGLEATAFIRQYCQTQGRKHIPILGMTAHALTGDREKCLAAGMDDYLSKPFNSKELKQKIETLIAVDKSKAI